MPESPAVPAAAEIDSVTNVYLEAPGAATTNLLLRLGRALHVYGYPAPSLEASLSRLARHFGIEAQFFSTPTSLFSSFGRLETQRTYLQRVEPGEVHLERLSDLHELLGAIEAGKVTVAEATSRVNRLLTAQPRFGWFVRVIAYGLSSGGTALFLGGALAEMVSALAIGLATGLLAALARRWDGLRAIFEPAAAALAAFLAGAAAAFLGGGSVYIATLAGLIVLLPGFSLTVALTELATRHLASGTARLAGAGVSFLTVGFGVAVGTRLATGVFGRISATAPIELVSWTEWIALAITPLAFVVLLRAAPRDAPWIVAMGALAVESGRLAATVMGPEMGAFAGAIVVALASRLFERLTRRPAAITLVPGILLLVPGAIGFRSVAQLLDRDVVLGVETIFRMAFIAISLVAGLLVANALTPRRRALL
jgi:uncharacterized membrane protein YjjP (DUF1212 family)